MCQLHEPIAVISKQIHCWAGYKNSNQGGGTKHVGVHDHVFVVVLTPFFEHKPSAKCKDWYEQHHKKTIVARHIVHHIVGELRANFLFFVTSDKQLVHFDQFEGDERRNPAQNKQQPDGFVMVHTVAFNKLSSGFARILNDFFDGVQKAFVGVDQCVLNFVGDVFFIDGREGFLSAIETKISIKCRSAISTAMLHFFILMIVLILVRFWHPCSFYAN